MTISRIDDADNLHVTYQQKVTSVIWTRVIISIIVLFFGTIAWGFAEMETEHGGIVPMIAALIIALLILSGYLKMSRNNNYFAAYVFDENILYRVDLTEAFGNDTLLGKSYSINNRNGVFQRMKVTANMQKIRETAHLEAFICNKDVINYGGYVIENVFDISEDREFLRVKAQLKGFRLFNSYSRKKTIYIPKSFTNFDALRYELEKLI